MAAFCGKSMRRCAVASLPTTIFQDSTFASAIRRVCNEHVDGRFSVPASRRVPVVSTSSFAGGVGPILEPEAKAPVLPAVNYHDLNVLQADANRGYSADTYESMDTTAMEPQPHCGW